MPTPIGTTPDGGLLVQADDGTTYTMKGNSLAPAPAQSDADVGAGLASTGGGSYSSGSPTGPGPEAPARSSDIPGFLRKPVAFATGLYEGATGQDDTGGGALDLNAARHDTLNAAGRSIGTAISPFGLAHEAARPGQGGIGKALGDFLLDRDPEQPGQPAKPAPAAPGAPQPPTGQQPAAPTQPAGPTRDSGSLKVAGATGTGTPARPGTSAYDLATQQRAQAEQDAAKARADRSTALGEEYGKQSKALSDAEGAWQQHVQTKVQEGQARLKEMDDLANGKPSEKLDPERWWKSRSEGQKVMGTIALALGGFASAFGAENTGGKLISDAIARDVDAQRFNIQQSAQDRRDKLAAKGNAFGHFMALLGDERAAHEATMAYQLKQGALRVEQMTAAMKAPEEVANGKAIAAQLAQEAEDHKLNAAKVFSDLQTQALQRDQMRFQMAYQQASREMLAKGQVPPELRGQAVYDSSGKVLGLAPTEKEAEQARQMVGDADGLMKEIEEAKRLAREWGSSSNKTQAGAAYKAKLDAIIGKLNSAQGIQQAVNEEQRKLYMETFGNSAATPSDATVAGLAGLEQTLRTNVNSRLRAFGPGMRTPFADPAQVGFKPAGGR